MNRRNSLHTAKTNNRKQEYALSVYQIMCIRFQSNRANPLPPTPPRPRKPPGPQVNSLTANHLLVKAAIFSPLVAAAARLDVHLVPPPAGATPKKVTSASGVPVQYQRRAAHPRAAWRQHCRPRRRRLHMAATAAAEVAAASEVAAAAVNGSLHPRGDTRWLAGPASPPPPRPPRPAQRQRRCAISRPPRGVPRRQRRRGRRLRAQQAGRRGGGLFALLRRRLCLRGSRRSRGVGPTEAASAGES